MPGETDMRALLAAMTPTLRPQEYVFCTLPPGESPPDGVVPFATVCEDEGLTVVLDRAQMKAPERGGDQAFRAITLGVHSSLDAVGFIAVIARALADAGIAANVLAGYHHDHLLVPRGRAEQAMTILRGVADRARGRR